MRNFISQGAPGPAAPGPAAAADAILDEFHKLAAGELPTGTTAHWWLDYEVPSVWREVSSWQVGAGHFRHFRRGFWVPWYTPYCVPLWLAAWWWYSRRVLRHRAA
jgi:hypothetical protein